MTIELAKGFKEEELSAQDARQLKSLSRQVRGDVLRMNYYSGGGPVGGALSTVEMLATLAAAADVDPSDAENPKRDRIVVAHEHATPAFYAVLGRFDFFDLDDAVCLYRKAGSIFEGRLERSVPGVEWNCGNPGQGLAAACGLALSTRWRSHKPNIFVVMSDEEQQRGEIAEARRFAKKYRLNNITALIDANNVQQSGKTSEIMPQNLKYEYIADGWDVIEINGHDPAELYQAVRRASQIQSTPVLVMANTTMGSGVSFMENQPEYYTRPLSREEFNEAMAELGETLTPEDEAECLDYRLAFGDFDFEFGPEEPVAPDVQVGKAVNYGGKDEVGNMDAFSATLLELGELNRSEQHMSLAVFDCAQTLEVNLDEFAHKYHESFLQSGLGVHSATTVAAAMSGDGIPTLLAGPGVYSINEAYNQLRLGEVNRSNLKLVATHLGLDAGSDGKAMQCVDYMGLAANLYNCKLVLPADANQTDRALRYMMRQPGNWILGLGQSRTPVITTPRGKAIFGGDNKFEYGQVTEVRPGDNGVIITTGQMSSRAIEIWTLLKKEGMAPALLHASSPLELDRSEDPEFMRALRKGRVITYEDHNVHTGLGSRVANVIARRGISCRLLTLGIDRYGLCGSTDDLYRWAGLDVEQVVPRALKFLKR
jgi:transketolase